MRYAAFLRAINVGGRTVAMARLKAIFESVGFQNVHTVIASGNVVFDAANADEAAVQQAIEDALHARLGWGADTFVRTRDELEEIVRRHPFLPEEAEVAAAFNVAFLHSAPSEEALARLRTHASSLDRFESVGREVFWLCQVKQSESEFSNAVLEKTLQARSTMRGMATVRRVLDTME